MVNFRPVRPLWKANIRPSTISATVIDGDREENKNEKCANFVLYYTINLVNVFFILKKIKSHLGFQTFFLACSLFFVLRHAHLYLILYASLQVINLNYFIMLHGYHPL